MAPRLEEIARTSSDFAADYAERVLKATATLTDRLLDNVATLTRGMIEDTGKVIVAVREAFLP